MSGPSRPGSLAAIAVTSTAAECSAGPKSQERQWIGQPDSCRELMASLSDDLTFRVGGPELVAWHHRNGAHRDAPAYLECYRRVLLNGLSCTRLLYLDANYWVRLRDAELGRGTPEAVRLLQALRAMVRSREALCVSQLHSLLEVGKQQEESLRASASLIDELTEGVAIASPSDLREWECAEFIKARLGRDVGRGLCAWTKVGQIHKNELPTQLPGPISEAGREVVLKATIDSLWNASFEYAFGQFGWDTKSRLNADLDPEVFEQVQTHKAQQVARGTSRDAARLREFTVTVSEQLQPVFVDLLRRWHLEHRFPDGLAAVVRDLRIVLDSAVDAFKNRTLGQLLPSAAIPTELYALYETNDRSSKPLTINDWVDWSHAAVALPYCNMFFTERRLAHQLRQELRADRQYECEVIGTLEEGLLRLHGAESNE